MKPNLGLLPEASMIFTMGLRGIISKGFLHTFAVTGLLQLEG